MSRATVGLERVERSWMGSAGGCFEVLLPEYREASVEEKEVEERPDLKPERAEMRVGGWGNPSERKMGGRTETGESEDDNINDGPKRRRGQTKRCDDDDGGDNEGPGRRRGQTRRLRRRYNEGP